MDAMSKSGFVAPLLGDDIALSVSRSFSVVVAPVVSYFELFVCMAIGDAHPTRHRYSSRLSRLSSHTPAPEYAHTTFSIPGTRNRWSIKLHKFCSTHCRLCAREGATKWERGQTDVEEKETTLVIGYLHWHTSTNKGRPQARRRDSSSPEWS